MGPQINDEQLRRIRALAGELGQSGIQLNPQQYRPDSVRPNMADKTPTSGPGWAWHWHGEVVPGFIEPSVRAMEPEWGAGSVVQSHRYLRGMHRADGRSPAASDYLMQPGDDALDAARIEKGGRVTTYRHDTGLSKAEWDAAHAEAGRRAEGAQKPQPRERPAPPRQAASKPRPEKKSAAPAKRPVAKDLAEERRVEKDMVKYTGLRSAAGNPETDEQVAARLSGPNWIDEDTRRALRRYA